MMGGGSNSKHGRGHELCSEGIILTWEPVDSCISEHGKHSAHELRAGAPRGSDSTQDLLYEEEQVGLRKRESGRRRR